MGLEPMTTRLEVWHASDCAKANMFRRDFKHNLAQWILFVIYIKG